MYFDNLIPPSPEQYNFREYTPEPDTFRYLLYRSGTGSITSARTYSATTASCGSRTGYILFRLARGSMQYTPHTADKAPVRLSEGDFLLADCRIPYSLTLKAGAQCDFLCFDGVQLGYYGTRLLKEHCYHTASETFQIRNLYSVLIASDTLSDLSCHIHLTGLLASFIIETKDSKTKIPEYVMQIKTEFEENYRCAYTLEELEKKYGVSRYRLCREFRTFYGTSPLRYLHAVRIRVSRRLLQESKLNINEIAEQVGYENVNHFIHHFKKTAGVTPAEYRKKISIYF